MMVWLTDVAFGSASLLTRPNRYADGPRFTLGSKDLVIFRHEKLANFCYFYGCLDHMEEDYKRDKHIENRLYKYGPWMRTVGQEGISIKEIIEILNRMNAGGSKKDFDASP